MKSEGCDSCASYIIIYAYQIILPDHQKLSALGGAVTL